MEIEVKSMKKFSIENKILISNTKKVIKYLELLYIINMIFL